MVDVLHVHAMGWTQTLESSVTSAAGVESGRRIQLDYPVTNVTGVFDNDAGTGTNYWTMATLWRTDDPRLKQRAVRIEAKYIVLAPGTGLAAATAAWVTYDVPNAIRPLYGGYGATGLVGLAEIYSKGLDYNFTGFTEMTGPTAGTPVEVDLEPGTGGLAVKSIKVLTDGTNINLYIYKASTASYANLIYRLDGINLMEIDNAEWVIPIANTSVWVGYQDVGANATQANTSVEIRGAPLV